MQILEKSVEQLNDIINKTVIKSRMLGRDVETADIMESVVTEEIVKVANEVKVQTIHSTEICVSDNNGTVREIEHEISKYCRGYACIKYKARTSWIACKNDSKANKITESCIRNLGVKRYTNLGTTIICELKPEIGEKIKVEDILKFSELALTITVKLTKINVTLKVQGKFKDFESEDIDSCMEYFRDNYYKGLKKRLSKVSTEVSAKNIRTGNLYISCCLHKRQGDE